MRMLRLCAGLLAVLVLGGCASGSLLFNGEDLDGWESAGEVEWQVSGSELVASGDGDGFLLTLDEFRDFQLSLEFWVDAETNSGVFIRCQDRNNIHPETCFELNIWDRHPHQEARTGAIVFRVMPPLAQVETIGKWNTYEVNAQGGNLVVKVNGVITAIMTNADPAGGFIALQHAEKGTIRFRNIRIATQ
jgi:hypothetical protein